MHTLIPMLDLTLIWTTVGGELLRSRCIPLVAMCSQSHTHQRSTDLMSCMCVKIKSLPHMYHLMCLRVILRYVVIVCVSHGVLVLYCTTNKIICIKVVNVRCLLYRLPSLPLTHPLTLPLSAIASTKYLCLY